jgi:hypothetical protein
MKVEVFTSLRGIEEEEEGETTGERKASSRSQQIISAACRRDVKALSQALEQGHSVTERDEVRFIY